MKKIITITALILSAIILVSCGAASSANVKTDVAVEDMLGFNRETFKYKSALDKNAELIYYSYMENGTDTAITSPVVVNAKLPSDWSDLGNNVFQKEGQNSLAMKAHALYKKTEGLQMNSSLHESLSSAGVTADLSSWSTCLYKTEAGYESVIYYSYDHSADTFSVYAYVELDENYILAVNMYDSEDMRGQVIDILDSLTIGDYDKYSAYAQTELRGYMNYLVNYFHEPYKIGDDLSDVNVTYLCFLYAFSNKSIYYDIGYDLERQVITLPLERAEEICTSLLGEHVNISDFDEKYLYENKNTADGKYGGIDGEGYIINYATDYWQGDMWHLDYEKYDDPLSITEDGNKVTVIAHIYSGSIGEYTSPRTLTYSFEKITAEDKLGNGFIYYRLVEIRE